MWLQQLDDTVILATFERMPGISNRYIGTPLYKEGSIRACCGLPFLLLSLEVIHGFKITGNHIRSIFLEQSRVC